MLNLTTLTLLALTDAVTRKQTTLSKTSILVYYGMNMEFEPISWFVIFTLCYIFF